MKIFKPTTDQLIYINADIVKILQIDWNYNTEKVFESKKENFWIVQMISPDKEVKFIKILEPYLSDINIFHNERKINFKSLSLLENDIFKDFDCNIIYHTPIKKEIYENI